MSETRDVFRHVEAELYAYPIRKREIERLREEILHPHDDEPDDKTVVKGANSVRQVGDPTGRQAIRLATNARLLHLQRVQDAVDQTIDQLPEVKREFVRVKYWTKPQRLTAIGICEELGISDRTFTRWRKQVVYGIAEKLGWK